MDRLSRRRVLQSAIAVSGTVGLAGCGAFSGSGVRLRELFVDNHRSTAQTVQVEVAIGEETVYEGDQEVPADGVRQLPCEWPHVAGAYELSARLGDGDWTSIPIRQSGDKCIVVDVTSEGLSFKSLFNCPTAGGRPHRCG